MHLEQGDVEAAERLLRNILTYVESTQVGAWGLRGTGKRSGGLRGGETWQRRHAPGASVRAAPVGLGPHLQACRLACTLRDPHSCALL